MTDDLAGTEDWAPGSDRAALEPGVIDVWRAELDHSGSRSLVRTLAGRYLGVDAAALEVEASGPAGKPAFADLPLRFNLTHSGPYALAVFALELEVGVDLELVRARSRGLSVARRSFGDAEADRLAALSPEGQAAELARLWTRHEAALKCSGVGIAGSKRGRIATAPWMRSFAPFPQTVAAVAAAAPPHRVRWWSWQG